MYRTHVRTIAHFAAESPEHTFRVGQFVLATIQAHLEVVPVRMRHIDAYLRGLRSSCPLIGHFTVGLQHLLANRKEVYDHLRQDSDVDCLLYLTGLKGFGMVKAGFYMQLCRYGGDVGCFDMHNLAIYQDAIDQKKAVRNPTRKTYALNVAIAEDYLSLCRLMGGSEKLWDTWCVYVANRRKKLFPGGAEQVSQLHVDAIIP